jgi:hypothetical protein
MAAELPDPFELPVYDVELDSEPVALAAPLEEPLV